MGRFRDAVFRLGLASFLLAILTRCFDVPGPESPAQGGRSWEEISTSHFTFETNWDDTDVVNLAREFEVGYEVMLQLAFPGRSGPGMKIRVFALTHDEFSQFTTLTNGRGGWDAFEPVVYWGTDDNWGALHELGHALSMSFIRRQPRWFAEGIAMYLQMIRYNERTGRAELGRCPPEFRSLTKRDFMTLDEMWNWSPEERETPREQRQYATSWAIVHYLLDERRDGLSEYEHALSQDVDPRDAWRQIFQDLDAAGFKRVIEHYLVGFKCETRTATIPAASISVKRNALGDAEVLGIRAWLYTALDGTANRARQETERLAKDNIARALAEDPMSFWAQLTNGDRFSVFPRSPADARRVVAREQDEWLAWIWYDEALLANGGSWEERRRALAKARELAPGSEWVERGERRLATQRDRASSGQTP